MKFLADHHSRSHFPAQYFKPYYSNNQLLFQFILSEFIRSVEEIKQINQHLMKLKPFWTTLNEEQKSQECHLLLEHISKLSGSSQHYMRVLAWNDDGYLTKLKNYCALLFQNSGRESKEQMKMQQVSNQAWLFSLQVLDIIRGIPQKDLLSPAYDDNLIYEIQTKLNKCIERLSRLVMRSTLLYHNDENVIFFLLHNREKLDALYNPGHVASLFRKMFPKGTQEVGQFLLKRYEERGFDNLIPIIKKKIAELKIK